MRLPPGGASLSTEPRQEALILFRNRINEAYFDPQFNGIDWTLTGKRITPRIVGLVMILVFWRNLDRDGGELGDAHTRVCRLNSMPKTNRNKASALV